MVDVARIVPTFFVADVRRSVEWYQTVMGFALDFLSAEYAGVALGDARIHLAQRKPSIKGAAYVQLRSGIDGYIAQIQARGQAPAFPLKDHDYGMREATLRDPDGNDL